MRVARAVGVGIGAAGLLAVAVAGLGGPAARPARAGRRDAWTGGLLDGRRLAVPRELSPAAAAAVAATPQRSVAVEYRAHDGAWRRAIVLLPAWYGPRRHPAIPLVISPHGRGVTAAANARVWGRLPAFGGFAVVNPEGEGRRLVLYSWGAPGEIADLARLPGVVERALPWLRIDRRRIYAVGGSMGGQETLLLVARRPRLLAGAIAFDAPTDLAARYRDFPRIARGRRLQRLAVDEVGGPPWRDPRAWAVRSPVTYARQIAASGVPLQIWWSRRDRIVTGQEEQSGRLFAAVERLRPRAHVAELVGMWGHTQEMHWSSRLPGALALAGVLPPARARALGVAVAVQP